MKFIHCADLHLDSPMSAHLSKEKIKERKAELLGSFIRMVDYAKEHGIEVILITGDLFDQKIVSQTVRKVVWQVIKDNEDILFFYLRGNHDEGCLEMEKWELNNLKLFHSEWRRYVLHCDGKRIAITGIELTKDNSAEISTSLTLDYNDFNIVMLHGQEEEYSAKDRAEIISLDSLRNKGIDYLALGHVHAYKKAKLDARGIYCYPGCLEGRGFDECGEHGFVLLDIDVQKKRWDTKFIPFASRCLYRVEVDISGCDNTSEIVNCVREVLAQYAYGKENLIEICLVGQVALECEKNLDYLVNWLKEDYYYVHIKDDSKKKLDYNAYLLDVSLKGEFIRCVREQSDLNEEEKASIIGFGLQALAGEEI